MSVDETSLLSAIEVGMFQMPFVPGLSEPTGIPHILGRITKQSHPLANLVGASTLTSSNADATIQQVYDLYSRQSKA